MIAINWLKLAYTQAIVTLGSCISRIDGMLNRLYCVLCGSQITFSGDTAKPFRDLCMTILLSTAGYFTILFQIGLKDKHGKSIRQEDHFELFRLDAMIRQIKEDKNGAKMCLPRELFSPYLALAIMIPANLLLYHFEMYNLLVAMCLLSLIFAVIYVNRTLRIMYAPSWFVKKVMRIQHKVYKNCETADAKHQKKQSEIIHRSYSILTSNDMVSVVEIEKIAMKSKHIIAKMLDNNTLGSKMYIYITGLRSFLVAYCLACSKEYTKSVRLDNDPDNDKRFKRLFDNLFENFKDTDSEIPTGYPIVIAWLAACLELESIRMRRENNELDGCSNYCNALADVLVDLYNQLFAKLNPRYKEMAQNLYTICILQDEQREIDALLITLSQLVKDYFCSQYDIALYYDQLRRISDCKCKCKLCDWDNNQRSGK